MAEREGFEPSVQVLARTSVCTQPALWNSILALQRLAELDQRKSEIIELLCFGGLTYDEAATALKISPATVHRELKLGKAWLHRELNRQSS